MREPLKDRVRLEHIVEAIDNVMRYTDGKSFNDMTTDDMMCYAVVYNIMSIGEAAYHLTKAFRNEHSETEWAGIMKMRNVLAHDYYKIKIQIVWEVVKHDLFPLRKQVLRYIEETNWEEWERNEVAIVETAVHKNLVQSAIRMKADGIEPNQIMRYTGLSIEEIDAL